MRIQSITLHNYKSFEGTCHVDGITEGLEPGKPIVLFGGLNGAGKTSIFEAILLCLYGRDNKTLFPSKGAKREDYYSYITSIINRNAKSQRFRVDMWIEIVFDQVELGGVSHVLSVKRKWVYERIKNSAEELSFEIVQNGRPIEFVSVDEYQDFVKNELIPYEVTQFFFFDGEKIQEFIKDEDKAFSESLESVLGIGLYRILHKDVNTVRSHLLNEYNKDKNVDNQLIGVRADMEKKELRLQECDQEIEIIEEEIENIRERITEIDKETYRITRINAASREEAEAEKERLNEEKTRLEEQIFGSIEDSLPFVMMSNLCQELLVQLEDEYELEQSEAARQAAESKVSIINQRVFEGSESEPPLTFQQKNFYRERIKMILLDTFGGSSKNHVQTLHSLSRRDIDALRQKIDMTGGVIHGLTQALRRFQEIEPRLRQIQRSEQRSVDDDTRLLWEEKGTLQEQIKTKQRTISSIQAEKDRLRAEITSLKRRQTELEEQATRTAHVFKQIEYCQKMREMLEAFSHRLRARKVEQLQKHTLDMWQQLARKHDQIDNIKIDPDNNFSINLYDSDGNLIDKTKLSAGEKELLALSLIWGLTQLTNRSLPVVIDTPLGRLDSEHRAHIAERYFTRASHQVILLSTDTEVVGEEYTAVAPFVSKHYLIEKESARETSRISEGYFK